MSRPGDYLDVGATGLAGLGRIGVAVSGGSDSLALLHLLQARGDLALEAATVDHGLRPEARDEADLVAAVCAGLGIAHHRLDWTGWDHSGNLQDKARRARYWLLAEWGRAQGLDAIAVGHTMDDQAETVLMRLARQAGVDGLAQMARRFDRDGMCFVRPLLGCRRVQLQDYLRAAGVGWVDDLSNADLIFDRVKARKALEALEPLGIDVPGLARVAAHMASAKGALGQRAAGIARRIARVQAGDIVLDRASLLDLPDEDARRLLLGALRLVAPSEYGPRAEPVAVLRRHIAAGTDATLHGCRITCIGTDVRVSREFNAVRDFQCPTDVMWDGRWRFDGPHAPDLHIAALGADGLAGCKDWRETLVPRESLIVSPAIWQAETLISAPIAGISNGWLAESAYSCDDYAKSLISH